MLEALVQALLTLTALLASAPSDGLSYYQSQQLKKQETPTSIMSSSATTRRDAVLEPLSWGIWMTAATWSDFPAPVSAATGTAAPLDAGEAIRRSAANIPGYGQTDVFYPESFLGKWKVTREVEFLSRPDSTIRLSYPMRFIRSSEYSAVVADRGYNQAELEKSIVAAHKGKMSSETAVLSYQWAPNNPNDLRITMSDGTKKEIKITKRAAERTEDSVSFSEFQRVTTEDLSGIPVIFARRIVSKWKVVDKSTLEAIEVVYNMGGGEPMAGASSKTGSLLSKSRLLLVK